MNAPFIFTVSELTRHIKQSLEQQYADIWVEGEISNLRIPQSGHSYLTLKDAGSQIRAVMFRAQRAALRFTPADGLEVICRGRINVYAPRGEYQILLSAMEPKGIGRLQLAFEQLKQKLSLEGLFAEAHKQALPFLPGRIVVITSATGAAVRDIIQVARRRNPGVGITVVPVTVQGDGAPGDIAGAIDLANRSALGDVIIVTRGGGSLEDLWAFNTEVVARAIFRSRLPVVSAVGHEIDFTIADFVADLRAPTPSAAAEIVVPEKRELERHIAGVRFRMDNSLGRCLERSRASLGHLSARLLSPARRLTDLQLRADDLQLRLYLSLRRTCAHQRTRLRSATGRLLRRSPHQAVAACSARLSADRHALLSAMQSRHRTGDAALRASAAALNALNPLRVLERGYSIVRRQPSMDVVRSAAQIAQGDSLHIQFSAGSAVCSVIHCRPGKP